MQHHHSLVSQSLQQTIDSLPSISDLSLNLISFFPISPEYGYGPVRLYVFEWLHVYSVLRVYVVCMSANMSIWVVFLFFYLVNSDLNLFFFIITIIFFAPAHCQSCPHKSRTTSVESLQSVLHKHCMNVGAGPPTGYCCVILLPTWLLHSIIMSVSSQL